MARHASSESQYAQSIRRAVHVQSNTQFRFDTDLLLPYKVDEVSILWRTLNELRDFAKWAADQGVDVFNGHVLDTMFRQDQPGHFRVAFEFMRLPGHEWRIEAMNAGNGSSPLHTRMLQQKNNGAIMHASFKVPDEDAYKEAVERLAAAGLQFGAQYRNTYGAFSYWSGLGNVWIKPRVNLRDREPSDGVVVP